MTRDEAIREACRIFALAYQSIGDFTEAADGFCDLCPSARPGSGWDYRNAGKVFDYVRQAVLQKLTRDGFAVAPGFDPWTGREKGGD